jgi:hypothetical protein
VVLPDGFAQSGSSSRYAPATPKIWSEFQSRVGKDSSRSTIKLQKPDFGALSLKPAVAIKLADKTPHRPISRPPSAVIPKPNTVSDSPRSVKVSSLRPAFPLPKETPSESRANNSREGKTSSMLLNPPILNSRKENSSMKPVPGPPPLPRHSKIGPPPPLPSKLKTISTTRVAIATDPRTENGSAELFSMFLQHIKPTHVDSLDKELGRGLEQSPEKNKGGAAKGKYVRCVIQVSNFQYAV